jgi:predicted GNAT family acetyltransferase
MPRDVDGENRKLDETIEETFPASDAPANTVETGIRVGPDATNVRELSVRDNTGKERFEIAVEGQIAFLQYRREPQTLVLIHTEVPLSLRGHGLASRLSQWALDTARGEGLRTLVLCPFVRTYLKKHPVR